MEGYGRKCIFFSYSIQINKRKETLAAMSLILVMTNDRSRDLEWNKGIFFIYAIKVESSSFI